MFRRHVSSFAENQQPTFSPSHMRFLLPLFVSLQLVASAQPFDHTTYTWSEKLSDFKLTTEEKQQSLVVISSKKFVEYTVSKEKGVEKFLVTHTIQALNDDRAVEATNKIYVPIGYTSQLENIKSRVFQNGKLIAEQGMKDVKKLEEKEMQYYLLALEGLGKGTFVETIIYLKLSTNLYATEYLQGQNLSREVTFTLITPKYLLFSTKAYNTTIAPIDTVLDDKRYIHYQLQHVVGAEDEKYALENANRARIEYTFEKNSEYVTAQRDTWSDMGALYFNRIFKDYGKNAKEIKRLLKNLNLKDQPNEAKAFLIENYIKTTFNLVPEAEDAPSIASLVKNKYTNTFGIVQLLVLSLEQAAVPYEIVITCDKDSKRFDPDFDSWSYLSEILIYQPDSKSYITPNNVLLRLGYPESNLLGQKGVFISPLQTGKSKIGITSIKTIAPNEMEKSKDKHLINVVMDNELTTTTIQIQRSMSDYAQMGIKSVYHFADEKQKKEILQSLLTNGDKEIQVKDAKADHYNISQLIDYRQSFKFSGTLTTDAYLEKAGENILLKLGELIGPQEEIYQEKKRQNPIDMPYAHVYEREIHVKIPAGYQLDGLDKILIDYDFKDAQGPMFGFKSFYKIENEELIVYCTEHYNRTSFTVDQFEDFRKVINAAADFNKIIVLLKKVD